MDIKEALDYDPETGLFYWKINRKKSKPGDVAGGISTQGYIQIMFEGKCYLAHRLAFLFMTGNYPSGYSDHIDGNRLNNSWKNLRDVTNRINGQNQRAARVDNKTGFLGVSPNKNGFSASIKTEQGKVHLGTYKSAEEAHEVYLRAKRKLHVGCTI